VVVGAPYASPGVKIFFSDGSVAQKLMRFCPPGTCTRDRHKKVVRCITNVSEAVVHLRRETL